ncbi:MAG: hypothetical protein WC222_12380 [Parachlamydiales bacterium]|jgi:proteic killer suppression protein
MALDLAFSDKQLRQICEAEALARRELGERVAAALKHRLADLRAATSVKDLIAGNPRELGDSRAGDMAVDLVDGHTMIFRSNHAALPVLATNLVDWSRVTRIQIIKIGSEYA